MIDQLGGKSKGKMSLGYLDGSMCLGGYAPPPISGRPISREDYPTLFRWRSDIEAVQMLNFRRNIITYEQFVSELEHVLPSSTLLLIFDRKSGSAVGFASQGTTGTDVVHAHAYPSDAAGTPIGPARFLGAATLGGDRQDVATAYGPQCRFSGYSLSVSGLSAGYYHIVVYVHSSVSGTWNNEFHPGHLDSRTRYLCR